MKARKLPIIVEAEQWFYHSDKHPYINRLYIGEPGRLCSYCSIPLFDHGLIDTLEGSHICCPGDWIITGVKGERYPCKDDIFRQTYEILDYEDKNKEYEERTKYDAELNTTLKYKE